MNSARLSICIFAFKCKYFLRVNLLILLFYDIKTIHVVLNFLIQICVLNLIFFDKLLFFFIVIYTCINIYMLFFYFVSMYLMFYHNNKY